jgi:hypothetical protein
MSKIFVIAGNHEQATVWMKENIKKRMANGETTVSYSDYVLRVSQETLRGVANPHGVFIGTWKERDDLNDIFMNLLNHTSRSNQSSHAIITGLYDDWINHKHLTKLYLLVHK